MSSPILLKDLIVPTDRTALTRDFFNSRFKRIVDAISENSSRLDGFQSIEDDLVSLGLQRLNLSLGPLLTQLQQAADQGFLMAQSSSENTLFVGNVGAWVITAEGGRDLFQPTPFIVAMDNADPNHWAVLGSVSYDRSTGILQGSVIYVEGSGTTSAWTLAASPATVPAMADMLHQAEAIRDEINGSVAGIGQDIQSVEDALAALSGSGAVVSVAGKAGVVVLQLADITGLTSALAQKLDVNAATSLLIAKAPLASPQFTGTPTTTTPSTPDTSTRVATTACAWAAIASLAASQAEAEAGLDNTKLMSPLRTAQAIRALMATALVKATQTEAETGADDIKFMTPLQTRNAMIAHVFEQAQIYQLDVALAGKINVGSLGSASTKNVADFQAAGNYQTQTPSLTALAGLVSAADRLPFFSGSGLAALATLTAFARTLLAVVDAPTMRTTLGLGDAATRSASEFVPLSGGVMTGPQSIQVSGNAIKGPSGSGTKTFLYTDGNVQTITNSADHAWAFAGWPAGGTYAELMIICTNAGAHVLTFPTVRWIKGDGSYSNAFSDLGISLPSTGLNFFMFFSIDGGANVYGRVM
jgi:hypothetical protein